MTVVGPNFGTGSDESHGDTAWTNPDNIAADDANLAECGPNKISHYLVCDHLGFAVPSGAVITDVSFSYSRKAEMVSVIQEEHVILVDGGNDVADSSNWSDSAEIITKHGGDAYWGVTLTPAMVNSASFGIKIAADSAVAGYMNAYVNYVTCTITYSLSSSGRSRAQLIGPM